MSGGAAWSRRLWSLWELVMEKFPAETLCETVSEIERLISAASKEESDRYASQEFAAAVNKVHQKAGFIAARGSLKETLKLVKGLVEQYQHFEIGYDRASHELESLLRLMKSELD